MKSKIEKGIIIITIKYVQLKTTISSILFFSEDMILI